MLSPSRECYPIRFERNDESSWQLILAAGSVHGITAGAEFTIFLLSNTALQEQTALVTVVESARAFTSVLHIPSGFTLTQPSVAVQTRAGRKEDLCLYVHPQDTFHNLFRSACESKYRSQYCLDNITIVDNPGHAHLGVRVSTTRNKVIFDMRDERTTSFGFKHQFDAVDADVDMVALVLGRAAHFYRTLNRVNGEPRVTGLVRVGFYRLQKSGVVNDSSQVGPNLCRNGMIDFLIDEAASYGLEIVNESSLNLYAYLFYFDPSDLSISESTFITMWQSLNYYPSAPCYKTRDAFGEYKLGVLLNKKGGKLTVGYDSGGIPPFSYHLRMDQDMVFGFIKLFVSTNAIDLSSFRQDTPFLSTLGMDDRAGTVNETKLSGGGLNEIWDSSLISIIQRRYSERP